MDSVVTVSRWASMECWHSPRTKVSKTAINVITDRLTSCDIENAYVLVFVGRNEQGHCWVRCNRIYLCLCSAIYELNQ